MSAGNVATTDLTFIRLPDGEETIRKWAAPIAALTRDAYTGSDPIPGLPPPDGSRDTPSEVADELRAGVTVWAAFTSDGTLAGAARVRTHRPAEWEISRVATAPVGKGQGVARRLVTAIEEAAVDAGIPRIRLDAVIERCLPSFYASLGYQVASHWPSPDKPLTEVTMDRDPATPRQPEPFPWARMPAPAAPVVCWLTGAAGLWAVIVEGADDVSAAVRAAAARMTDYEPSGVRLAGVDLPTNRAPHPYDLLAQLEPHHPHKPNKPNAHHPPNRPDPRHTPNQPDAPNAPNQAEVHYAPNQPDPRLAPNHPNERHTRDHPDPRHAPDQHAPRHAPNQSDAGYAPGQHDPRYPPDQPTAPYAPKQRDPRHTPNQPDAPNTPNQTEVRYASAQPDVGYAPNQSDPGYVPDQHDVRYAPNQAEVRYASDQSDPRYASVQPDVGHAPNQHDPRHAPNQFDAGYAPGQYDPRYPPDQPTAPYAPKQRDPRHAPDQHDVRYAPDQSDAGYAPGQPDLRYAPGRSDVGYASDEHDEWYASGRSDVGCAAQDAGWGSAARERGGASGAWCLDVRYAGPVRTAVPAHVAPRTLHPENLAFWRLPPGREAEIDTWR